MYAKQVPLETLVPREPSGEPGEGARLAPLGPRDQPERPVGFEESLPTITFPHNCI